MSEISPLSPHERALRNAAHSESEDQWFAHLNLPRKMVEIARRTIVGVYSDGFSHAGNFAYMALLAVFAFFIAVAAIIGAFGVSETGREMLDGFFAIVPPSVAEALDTPVESAMGARSGAVLWLSAIVGLWTTASLIETFRDIVNRAYGTKPERHFWQYRLGSIFGIIAAIFLMMLFFSAQILISAAEQVVYDYIPAARDILGYAKWGKIIPFFALFTAIYVVFHGLTPREYRARQFKKWPGAALVSLWWLGCTSLLPIFLSFMANYDLTYGSLAGVMITLIFFYLIGLGLVTGAQLNAALANADENSLRELKTADDKE